MRLRYALLAWLPVAVFGLAAPAHAVFSYTPFNPPPPTEQSHADILDNTFVATLVLEQKLADVDGEWTGKRKVVRIDARPSDCLIIALKTRTEIFVTPKVLEKVKDISEQMNALQPETDDSDSVFPFRVDDFEFEADFGEKDEDDEDDSRDDFL